MFLNSRRLLLSPALLHKRCDTFLWLSNYICKQTSFVRCNNFSTSSPFRIDILAERIEKRSLIKLSGSDTPSFLQGLVTNDIRVLENSLADVSMYCMMLNTQGRVLYDLLLYKVNKLFEEDQTVLLECDSKVLEDLIKILSRYKLRKKVVSFSKVEKFSVWSVFPNTETSTSSKPPTTTTTNPTPTTNQQHLSDPSESEIKIFDHDKILFFSPDPRIPSFGHRLLLPSHVVGSDVIEGCTNVSDSYTDRRFQFGLSEGITDLPPANCFPLEANLHFFNGVSFNKGCYVGQELTARTHHTGVIRKRLMPLFSRNRLSLNNISPEGLVVVCETTGKECGKVRSWKDEKGIALLRLHEAILSTGPLLLRSPLGVVLGRVETFIPHWWPRDGDEIIRQVMAKQDKM